jgi:intracellular sulfur oxidation DsrE/DsrF family protein
MAHVCIYFKKNILNKCGSFDTMKRSLRKLLLWFVAILICNSAWSSDVESLLGRKESPAGVVFEIVSDQYGLLGKLLPSVKQDIKTLRERYPDLPVAVVTHGSEQFDLMIESRATEAKAHNLVEQLAGKDNVEVHVCGTHAEWYGKTPEDFPDYVNVSAAGPTQINDYEAMGYEVIVLP